MLDLRSRVSEWPDITDALLGTPEAPTVPAWLPWRTERKLGRTIYAQVGYEPSEDDVLIGMMDTAELANEAIVTHNFVLKQTKGMF
jgi:hypothetical protein